MKKILNMICHPRVGGNLLAILFVFLAACTDYVQQIDERNWEWNDGISPISPSSVVTGEMTDFRDNQTYKTVKIGDQVWMAQNLNYETANSYCYDGYASCSKYGRLYTWAAAMDSVGTWSANGKGCGFTSKCSSTNPVRGVCPEGWHLPTQTEWNTLFTAVGGQSTAGKMLKSTSGWYSSGNGTDAYSFSALPAGYRNYDGYYYDEGGGAYFWSSTEGSSYYAYGTYLDYNLGDASLSSSRKYYGFSVRCLKDDESEQTEESSSSSYVAECTPVSAHKVTLSNALQSSQSAINFETGLSDNPHITIKFANDAATIIPGDGVTVYEDNSQTTGLEAEVQPGNTSVCREDFRKSTFQYGEELTSGLWLDIVDASGNIYPMMVKKAMFESSTKGMVDIVYYK